MIRPGSRQAAEIKPDERGPKWGVADSQKRVIQEMDIGAIRDLGLQRTIVEAADPDWSAAYMFFQSAERDRGLDVACVDTTSVHAVIWHCLADNPTPHNKIIKAYYLNCYHRKRRICRIPVRRLSADQDNLPL